MKLTHIFALVIVLHFGVAGALLFLPGCKGVGESIRPQGDRASPDTPFGEPAAHAQGTESTVANDMPAASPDSSPMLLPPTRPSWNISGSSQPEVIEGEAVYEETGFNAINPELSGIETVEVEETTISSLGTEETYTVVKGDNLTKIAKTKGVMLSDLMAANSLNKDSIIRVGQVLIIPADSLAGPAAPSAPTLSAVDVGEDGKAYTVVSGDTLGGIAKRHGTSVSAIRGANNLSGSTIYAGQQLIIPSGSGPVPTPPPVAAEPVETRSGESTYVVQSGDTLGAIASRYDVTVRDLAARNNISDPRKLRAGQTLIVPAEGANSSAAPVLAAPKPQNTPRPAAASRPVPAPVPAPSETSEVPVDAPTVPVEVETIDTMDFDNLDDIPVVPVQTTE